MPSGSCRPSLVAGPLEVGAAEADRIGVPARMLAELREIGERLDSSGLGNQDLSTGYRRLAAAQARPGLARGRSSATRYRGGLRLHAGGRPGG